MAIPAMALLQQHDTRRDIPCVSRLFQSHNYTFLEVIATKNLAIMHLLTRTTLEGENNILTHDEKVHGA